MSRCGFRGFNAAASLKHAPEFDQRSMRTRGFRGFNAAASLKRLGQVRLIAVDFRFRGFNAAASLKPRTWKASFETRWMASAVLMPRPH